MTSYDRMISVHFQGKPISQESKSMPQPIMLKKLRLDGSMKTYKTSRTNTQKICPFHHRGLGCENRMSRDTWSIFYQGEFGLGVHNKAGQRLTEFCQENTLVIANTLFQQHKRRLYTWTSPDGQYWNQIDYIFAAKDGEALYSQQKQDRELTVAQIMNSLLPNSDILKKVGKTTRPSRYNLNQIPYNYTVEVTNRFKGLDLIECLKNYGQRFVTL